VGGKSKKREYDDVNLEASDLSYTSQFPFTLSATTPGNGKLKLDGKAGPLNRTDTEQTPVDAKLKLEHFDLGATGFTDVSSGLAGLLNFTGTLNSDGRRLNSGGKIEANKLQLVQDGSPSRVPVNIDYDTDYELKPQAGVLKRGEVHIGKALARLTGAYNAAGETTTIQMKLSGQNMPVQDLEAALPALGVILPSGSSLQSGTLNANLDIRGPVDRLVTTGPVNLSNARLANFDLGSKLGTLSAFTGISRGADTTIQTFASDVRVAPEATRVDNLNLIVPAIGTLTGGGTIGANHSLNFKMRAILSAGGQSPMGGLANIGGLGQAKGQSSSGIPFMIQGTTANPVFVPDVAGMAGEFMKGKMPGTPNAGSQQQTDVGGLIQGLLGKKKKP
jgi:AsmA protein